MKFDIVIIGGGVIGSAIAYFLSAQAPASVKIAVIEKDPSYQEGSTARSAGGIRQQFSTPENIRISQFATQFLRTINDHLSVNDDPVDVSFQEKGYLFLAQDHQIPVLYGNHQVQTRENVPVQLLDPEDLARVYPWMTVSDLAGGSISAEGEGWLDAYSLNQAFRKKAISQGVQYIRDTAQGLLRQGQKIDAVLLENTGAVHCGTVVNAAGPHAATIAEWAGISLNVRPRKRFIYSFTCRTVIENCPLTIDPSGVYFRPEGHQFITGCSPAPENDPDCLDFNIDYGWFEEHIWPILAHRVPAFEAIKLENAWAGHYAYNILDQNAVLGRHPDVQNFIFANGFSGHGLQQAPAVGRALSELILHGQYQTLNLDRFSYQRMVEEKPLSEINVV
ncbi:NAD(P)/FAD-dependent oxidoreductase [Sneathiella sp.]|jgi:FAD-dependent oxidoreductase domain-containing protein 1|uniref:NAD(P)/FAD-dependent oxidoreductase n=1 Tax=Sneathiella sp. TaxID=1964365 RepID=UPI0039E41F92